MSDEEDEALCYDEPADQLVTPNHRGDNDDAASGEEFLYLGAMMFSFREVRHILRRALALLTSASLLHNNSNSDRDIAVLSVEELQKMMVMTVLGRDDGHMPHDAEPQRGATKEEQEEADEETGDLDREKTDSALHGLLATLHGFLEQYRVVPRTGRVAGLHDGRSEVPIEASIREGPNNSAAVVTAASIPSGRGRQSSSSTSLNVTTSAAVVESDEKPSPSVAVPSGPSGAPPPPARAGSARAVIANAVAAARDIATTRRPNSAAAAVAAAAISLPPPCLPPFRSSSATSFRPTTGGATNESNAALAHHGANHTATATIAGHNHNGALPLSSPTPPTGPGGPPGSVSVGSLVFPDYSRDAATTFQTIHKTLHHDDGKSIFAPLAYTESQFGGGVVGGGGGGAASPDAAIDIMADHTVTDKRRPTCVPLRNQNATSSHRDSDPLHALEPKRRHFVQQFFNDPKKIENRRQMMLAEELNKLAQTAQAAALLQYRPSSQNRHGAHSAHLQSVNATTTAAAAADLSFDGSVTTAPNHNLRLPSNWAGAASPVFVPIHRPASAPLVAAASSHTTAPPPSSSHPSMPLPTIDVEEVNSCRVATRADDAAAAAGDEPPHHLSITMDPAHRHPHHHPSQEEVVQSTRSVDVPFSQHVKSLRERRNNAAAAAVGNNSAAADLTTTAAAATGRPGSSSSATPPTVLAASHIYADKGLHQRHIAVSQDHVLSSSSSPSYAEVGLHSSSSLGHHSTTGHSRPGTALQHVWHTTMPSQRLPSPTIQSTSYTMPPSSLLLVSQHTSPLRQQQHAGTAMSQVAAPSASSPTPLATTPGTTAAVPSATTTASSAIVKPTTASVVERATARKVLSASHRVPSRVPLGGMGTSKPLL